MEDLLFSAISFAEKLGAKYVEARYHRNSLTQLSARNGTLLGIGGGVFEGIAIRVLYGGALGFSSTNILNKDSVKEAVKTAFDNAKAHSRLMKSPIEFVDSNMGHVKYDVIPDKNFDSMDLEEKIGMLNELWKNVKDVTTEAKIPVFFTYYSESVEEKIIINSDGAYIRSRVPRIGVGYNLVVLYPQKGSIQRFFSYGASGGLEWLREWNLSENIVDEAKTYEKILIEGKKPPEEPIDVIVGSEIVGLIVHESCGHPSEADRILGREAAQAGKSFIKPEMIGQRIGNNYATVIDDPTIPKSQGFYLYDEEGVPARARYLYKEGVINEFLHNRWTASIFNTESNGAARASNFYGEPIIRMANTYLKPGNMEFEELLEDVKFGVYMKSYMEWNIDDERWSQRYVGLESYLIENGELKEFVRNPALEITTKSFYSNIDGVDKNLKFYAGMCGKGEPAQGVPVWFGGPNVKLKNIRLRVVA